jgi:hypothetical protein
MIYRTPILATLYLPDLNPVSLSSVVALAVAIVLSVLTRETLLQDSPPRRRLAIAASPLLVLLSAFYYGGVLCPLPNPGRWFPDAEDYAGGIVCLAFAFGFGLRCLRLADPFAWFNGVVFGFASGSILTYEAADLAISDRGFRATPGFVEWIPFISMFAFWLVYLLVSYVLIYGSARQQRRRKLGLCVRCGYDLTGNASGICPECGQATR